MKTYSYDPDAAQSEASAVLLKQLNPDGEHISTDSFSALLQMLAQAPADIILLELPPEAQGGTRQLRRLLTAAPDSNLIFVSSHPEFAFDAFQLHASAFLLKPLRESALREAIAHLRYPLHEKLLTEPLLRVQCFGGFGVFRGTHQLTFRRGKTAELLAYLVYRRGVLCSNTELAQTLWSDADTPADKFPYLRKLIKDLRDTLHEAGADAVLIKEWGSIGIRADLLDCDYYRYLQGSRHAADQYRGNFIGNYSWAKIADRYF